MLEKKLEDRGYEINFSKHRIFFLKDLLALDFEELHRLIGESNYYSPIADIFWGRKRSGASICMWEINEIYFNGKRDLFDKKIYKKWDDLRNQIITDDLFCDQMSLELFNQINKLIYISAPIIPYSKSIQKLLECIKNILTEEFL